MTTEQVVLMEQAIRGQVGNKLWFQLCEGRVTTSVFRAAVHTNPCMYAIPESHKEDMLSYWEYKVCIDLLLMLGGGVPMKKMWWRDTDILLPGSSTTECVPLGVRRLCAVDREWISY